MSKVESGQRFSTRVAVYSILVAQVAFGLLALGTFERLKEPARFWASDGLEYAILLGCFLALAAAIVNVGLAFYSRNLRGLAVLLLGASLALSPALVFLYIAFGMK